MEIDDSIFGMKFKSPFGIDSPLRSSSLFLLGCPLSQPPLPPATHYLRDGLLSTANFSACMETWARWLPQSTTQNALQLPPNSFRHLFSMCLSAQKAKHLKPKGFILSIAPPLNVGGQIKNDLCKCNFAACHPTQPINE